MKKLVDELLASLSEADRKKILLLLDSGDAWRMYFTDRLRSGK